MMLDKKKIDQVDSFASIGSTNSKDGGGSKDVKSRTAKAHGVFFFFFFFFTVERSVLRKSQIGPANQDQDIGSYSDDSGEIWF